MTDMLKWMKDNEARLRQTETKEVPGAAGQSTFYAVGSWTPTLVGSTTAGTFTYSVQVGDWTRVGNTCFVRGTVRITAIGVAPAGNLQITGLPFTSVAIGSSGRSGGGAWMYWQGITLPAGYTQLLWVVVPGVTLINISRGGSNVVLANVQGGELVLVGGLCNFEFEGQYRVS